jgi:hypothetical protein
MRFSGRFLVIIIYSSVPVQEPLLVFSDLKAHFMVYIQLHVIQFEAGNCENISEGIVL